MKNFRDIYQTYGLMFVAILIALVFLNPLFVNFNLYEPTRSPKIFFFSSLIAFTGILLVIPSILQIKKKIGVLQILVSFLAAWIIFRGKTGGIWNDHKFYWWIGCIAFFFINLAFVQTIFSNKNKLLIIPVVAIIVVSFVEALLGQLQILGYFPVYHPQFIISGTFFNPAPYAGFLIAGIPWTVILIYNTKNTTCNKILYWIGIASVIFILLVLPATKSRAAYISLLTIVIIHLQYKYNITHVLKQYIKLTYLRRIFYMLIPIMLLSGGVLLYKMKSNSADGRLVIWKIAVETVKESPFMGHGYNTFQATYTPAQIHYFKNKQGTEKEKTLADNSIWAFNEPLQICSELGLSGGVIFLAIVIFSLFGKIDPKYSNHKILLHSARLSIIGILVFSLFSYPFYILPITLLLFFALSVVAALIKPINVKLISVPFNSLVITGILAISAYYAIETPKKRQAYTSWGEANYEYQFGNFSVAELNYHIAYETMKYNGLFLQQYGKCLAVKGNMEKAIEILEIAKNYRLDIYWYITMGDCYRALQQYEKAIYFYDQATYAVPHMFYPNYLMALTYFEWGKIDRAKEKANYVLNKKVKIHSEAIVEIKEEMSRILKN